MPGVHVVHNLTSSVHWQVLSLSLIRLIHAHTDVANEVAEVAALTHQVYKRMNMCPLMCVYEHTLLKHYSTDLMGAYWPLSWRQKEPELLSNGGNKQQLISIRTNATVTLRLASMCLYSLWNCLASVWLHQKRCLRRAEDAEAKLLKVELELDEAKLLKLGL